MILLKIFFVALLAGPVVLGFINYFRHKNSTKPEKTRQLNLVLNSAVLYSIAYNVIFFLQELFLVLGKKALGLTAYLYHNNHSWDGFHPMASLMQGSGALAIFVFGLVFWLLLRMIKDSKSIWKLLVLWLAFHGLIQSIPQVMIAGFDQNTDVGQALGIYLQFGPTLLGVLGAGSVVALVLVCISFSRPLLELAVFETGLENPKARLRTMRNIAALAALIGCILIIPFRLPPVTQIIGPFILLLFAIPWTWAWAARIKDIEPLPNDINERIRWEPIALLIVLLGVFQLVLAPGVKF